MKASTAYKILKKHGYNLYISDKYLAFEHKTVLQDGCLAVRNKRRPLLADVKSFCIECYNMLQAHHNHRLHAGLPF